MNYAHISNGLRTSCDEDSAWREEVVAEERSGIYRAEVPMKDGSCWGWVEEYDEGYIRYVPRELILIAACNAFSSAWEDCVEEGTFLLICKLVDSWVTLRSPTLLEYCLFDQNKYCTHLLMDSQRQLQYYYRAFLLHMQSQKMRWRRVDRLWQVQSQMRRKIFLPCHYLRF